MQAPKNPKRHMPRPEQPALAQTKFQRILTPMERPEYLELWTKIQQFAIDDETSTVRFSDKLASEQGWQPAFTARAIEEYKKFILLCCISPTGAAPSKIVDEVWHLHLTYTQSYWTDFCKNTLGKDIHHFPSGGGKSEDDRHREWYAATLDLYRETFGKQSREYSWNCPRVSCA
jgi:hypothetical protein